METKSIRIPKDTYDKLRKVKAKTGITIIWMIERAVEIMLRKEGLNK